jgi:hypothetical protein
MLAAERTNYTKRKGGGIQIDLCSCNVMRTWSAFWCNFPTKHCPEKSEDGSNCTQWIQNTDTADATANYAEKMQLLSLLIASVSK